MGVILKRLRNALLPELPAFPKGNFGGDDAIRLKFSLYEVR